jgi:ABC-type multidrug transport system fused ATPase/permease subunit
MLCPAHRHRGSQMEDTLYRIEQGVDRVAELSGDILPSTIQMMLMGIMVLVTMGVLNWHLTVLVAPILPIFYFLQRLCGEVKGRGGPGSKSVRKDQPIFAGTLGRRDAVATTQPRRQASQKTCSPGGAGRAASYPTASHGNSFRGSLGVSHRLSDGSDSWERRV